MKLSKPVLSFFLLSFIFNSCTVPEDGISIGLFSETIGDCKKITLFSDLNGDNKYSDDEPIVESFEICDGTNGTDGVSIGVITTQIDANCRLLTFYLDINLNGVKNDDERVVSTTNICDGVNGVSIKAITSSITDCTNGGFKYSFYEDTNNNNVLDESESVFNESVVCNGERGPRGSSGADGADGADGANGADGSQIGFSVSTRDALVSECSQGGVIIEVFLDTDLDGIKDSGETVLSNTIRCNAAVAAGIISIASNGKTLIASENTIAGNSYAFRGSFYKVVDNEGLITARDAGDDLTKIVTTKVTNMSYVFSKNAYYYASTFNQDISSWDTSNVTDMNNMFQGASLFNQDISSWDTSNVTDMTKMFSNALKFNKNLSYWCLSGISSTPVGFSYNTDSWYSSSLPTAWGTCPAQPAENDSNGNAYLTFAQNEVSVLASVSTVVGDSYRLNGKIYKVVNRTGLYSARDAGEDLSQIVTSKVTDMNSLFQEESTFNEDISSWDTSNVTDMYEMFRDATAFNQNIGSWDVSSVNNINYMFYYAGAFNQDLSGWCVQSNFSSAPSSFNHASNATWRNDSSKQPVWNGADGSGANCN